MMSKRQQQLELGESPVISGNCKTRFRLVTLYMCVALYMRVCLERSANEVGIEVIKREGWKSEEGKMEETVGTPSGIRAVCSFVLHS